MAQMTLLDRAIAYAFPGWAVRRVEARASLHQLIVSGDNSLGYSAGKLTIYDKGRVSSGTRSENAIDQSQFPRLRFKAWQLYRENKHARKIVRQLVVKTLGKHGLIPDPMPLNDDGTINSKAQEAIRNYYLNWAKQPDSRGNCGQGGQSFAGIQQTALRANILSGDTLYRGKILSKIEQDRRRLLLPLVIQLIDSERLPDDQVGITIENGHTFFRGIELDPNSARYRYWIYDTLAGVNTPDPRTLIPKPHSAAEIFHLYLTEDIDQFRGTTWFAPALNSGREIADLEYNVLKQTALGACIVAGYRLSRGKTRIGVSTGDSDDLTDANGNKVDRLHPGMFMNLGKDGDLKGFSPNINQAGQEALIQYFVRCQASALPGVKSTTLTGDYRNASFSSERSADNDIWPEIECVQQWFAENFTQPIYEAVIEQLVIARLLPGISVEYFNRNRALVTNCLWYGPVARAVNPKDEAMAATMRIHGGFSSPQIECAQIGRRYEDVVSNIADYITKCEEKELPEVYSNNVLGLDTLDLLTSDAAENGESGNESGNQEKETADSGGA